MKEKKQPVGGGFRLRLWYAIALILLGVVGIAVSTYLMITDGDGPEHVQITMAVSFAIGMIAIGESITQFIVTFMGRTDKWANILSIVIGVLFLPALIGVLGIVGGAMGLKRIKQLNTVPAEGKKKRNGFAGRLAMAFIWLLMAVGLTTPFILDAVDVGIAEALEYQALPILIPVGFLLLISILNFLAAFLGKRVLWVNYISVVTNSIFALAIFGILGLSGGERGARILKKERAEKKRLEAEEAEKYRLEEEQLRAEAVAHGEYEQVSETVEEPEVFTATQAFIQPKMSEKGKKGIMIALIVSYSLFLLAGILLASVPALANVIVGLGICEEVSGRAYAITIGVMWVALTPTIGYYFATISPYSLNKKNRIIIAASTTALLAVMNAVFFIVVYVAKIDGMIPIKDFYEGSDSWFVPLTMVFASLGIAVCYALTLFRIRPEKIAANKPELSEGHDLFEMVKYIFAIIGYFVLCLVKMLLTAKEKQPDIFILVASVLLTWLAFFVSFVFAIILIAAFVVVVVLAFTGLVKYSRGDAASVEKIVIYENGQDVELTRLPYAFVENGEKVYEDAYGHRYISTDGGKTVHRN